MNSIQFRHLFEWFVKTLPTIFDYVRENIRPILNMFKEKIWRANDFRGGLWQRQPDAWNRSDWCEMRFTSSKFQSQTNFAFDAGMKWPLSTYPPATTTTKNIKILINVTNIDLRCARYVVNSNKINIDDVNINKLYYTQRTQLFIHDIYL